MDKVILAVAAQEQYELLDTGGEEKLERFGSVVLARPDPQALWDKRLSLSEWTKADGSYVRAKGQGTLSAGRQGEWQTSTDLSKQWPIVFGGLRFYIRATSFKHTGLFPEQLSNWEWTKEKLLTVKNPSVLNLFAYTGGATLIAAQAGAHVTHVDASKTAVAWARENAELSGLSDRPIRWIVDDVSLFVKREIKRGNKYDAIIMDPPAFGHGAKDELWKIEEDFMPLMALCEQLLSDTPLFVLISGYAAGYSPLAFAYNLERFENKFGGSVSCGDLAIMESEAKNRQGEPRLLPCGIFGRWSR